MRAPISVGDIVKKKGSKKVKNSPVGIVVEVYEKNPQYVSAECIVLWINSDMPNSIMYTKELSRITIHHV
jgi:acyl-CoA hydrolase